MAKGKQKDARYLCGKNMRRLRLAMKEKMSQQMVAVKLQLLGVDLDRNTIQKMETDKRFVNETEIKALCQVFGVDEEELKRDYDSLEEEDLS